MMHYSDNPHIDFLRREADQERWLENRPRCDVCGEPIQDEYKYPVNGQIMCQDCAHGWVESIREKIEGEW